MVAPTLSGVASVWAWVSNVPSSRRERIRVIMFVLGVERINRFMFRSKLYDA